MSLKPFQIATPRTSHSTAIARRDTSVPGAEVPDDHHRDVVALGRALGELAHAGDDALHNDRRRRIAAGRGDHLETVITILVARRIEGLGDAVAEDDHRVASLELHGLLIVGRELEQAHHWAALAQALHAGLADDEWRIVAGVAIREAAVRSNRTEHQRHETRLQAAATKRLVHAGDGRGRTVRVLRLRRVHALHERAHERRGRPLAGNVAEREPEPARVLDVVEEISSDGPARNAGRGGLDVSEADACTRQQRLLDLRRDAHLLLHARLLELVAIEPGVLDGDRGLAR